MYKRRFSNRTPRSNQPPQISTSTPKTTVEAENDLGCNNFPMSGISFGMSPSQKRKGTEIVSSSVPGDAKKSKTSTYSSYFEEVVSKAGCTFKQDTQYVLTRDQAIFVRDVTSFLKKNSSFPKNVDDFFSGFEKHCSKNSNLKMALNHTKTSPDCTDARGAVQESMVRLLLSVEPLQSQILEFLLEKVAEFALTGDDDPDSNGVPWVRIILRQMRLLDRIVDGSSLNERLFSVLEAAPLAVQREIIFCLPDIIGDEQHHEAALQLSKILKTNFQLTAAIMEALDSLSLQNKLRAEVCEHMLLALNKAPPEFLPAIITFLVSSEGQDEDLSEVVAGLREKLDLSPAGGLDGSNQVLILSALSSGALSCRKLVDIWLKAISSTHNPSDLTLLDMAVLLLFHHFLPGRKKNIHNILRNRIKAGIITEAIIENTFTMLLAPIKEYVKTALHIATVLFRSPDPPVQYIGKVWFKLMLIHLEGHLSQSVILELLLLIGTGGVATATSALGVMSEVEPRHLQSHVLLLMGLLDNIHDMDLIQVGKVMDLLCSLVYGEGTDSMHHDEIHMMIRKHLSSSNDMLKQKGVVGAVMALKHMAISDSESEVCNSPNSSIDSSNLTGRAGQAKELLELVMESIQDSVLCVGLLYDQLATAVCSCSTIDTTFLRWITDKTIDKFQDCYVKELKQVAQEGCSQFSLESAEDEDEDAICLDIEGVLKIEKSKENGSETGHPLCVMAPLFRLLRSLQFRISNSLESVDGLLGCSVGMPKDLADQIDDFPGLNKDEQILVLDSLFYCLNWFRELINAFSLLRVQELEMKVLRRIENCIMLQKLLARGLSYARKLDYKPPRCHFYTDVKQVLNEKPRKTEKANKRKDKGKLKGKKKDAPNTSAANVNATVTADDPGIAVQDVDRSIYKCYFRELDMEVFTTLSRSFVLSKKDIKNDEPALHPGILLFLLEDYVAKLDHCLSNSVKRISSLPTSQQAAAVGFANLDRIAVNLIARRAVKLLPYIMKKLEITAQYCQELLAENDGIYDGPDMFKDGSAEIKLCFGMLLHAVASTVGWSGFHSSSYSTLLKDCLRIIASRQNSEHMTVNSNKVLVLSSCEYFSGYATRTVHLMSAENLVRVIQVLSSFVPSEAGPKKILADVCLGFLSRQWYTLEGLPENGAAYNRQVESLVKTYFTNVPDQLKVIESTAKWVEDEIKQLKNKDSSLITFPTIKKANFPILYRNLWYALESAINAALELVGGRNGAKFKIWTSASKVMAVLTSIIKQMEHRVSHQAYIKQSQAILKVFLSDGMPVLETLLKSKREDVPGMLKVLQVTTRYLHALCVSTKKENLSGLTAYVPVVRKTLETLIFRVKAMLVANNCTDAFWMGNLKNKTIRGDEILSQDTVSTEEQNGDEEDELPEDEHSDEDLDNDMDKRDERDDDDDKRSDSEIL